MTTAASTRPVGRRHGLRGSARPARLRVALVGADGAGKSTLSSALEHEALPFRVKRIYMGVNLEASSLMLPTTRLLLAAKRARGGRPDLVASRARVDLPDGTPDDPSSPPPAANALRTSARFAVWAAEEWFRELVAWSYGRRGYVVVFDRHFFADYYHADVAGPPSSRGPAARVHGWMLQHVYPKPDLVICLDAPGAVLHARKPEASAEWLEARRRQYLDLGEVVPHFVVVDADRPRPDVLADVVAAVQRHHTEGER